jgi:hypothetical protein
MPALRRYWFHFRITLSDPAPPPGIKLGCGVSARSRDDALRLVQDRVFAGQPLPPIDHEIEDVDHGDLDPAVVGPNPVSGGATRGIWFPRGYD